MSRWGSAHKLEAARLRGRHDNTVASYYHTSDLSRGYNETQRSCPCTHTNGQDKGELCDAHLPGALLSCLTFSTRTEDPGLSGGA